MILVKDSLIVKSQQNRIELVTRCDLVQMGGLEDFPLPTKIETLVRSSARRNLKSTKDKEMSKKRSLSWSSLTNPSRQSMSAKSSLEIYQLYLLTNFKNTPDQNVSLYSNKNSKVHHLLHRTQQRSIFSINKS